MAPSDVVVVVRPMDVYAYIPNVIGYFRIVATCLSYVLAISEYWKWSIGLYILSFVSDFFDI